MLARLSLFLGLVLGAASLAGCRPGAPAPIKVTLITGLAGLGDRSFDDEARAGLDACKRETSADVATVVPASAADVEPQLVLAATQNDDAVIALGFPMAPDVERVARRFQNAHFALIDAVVDEPNVESITFKEQEGAFLAGALAAMVSRTGHIAFLGGADAPLLQRSEAGFVAGAHMVGPQVRVVDVRYLGSFTDRAAGRRAAASLFDGGADIVFAVAGPAGLGAIDAVKARRGDFVIGADANQDGLAPGKVLTSVLKRVDRAAQRACTEAVAQKPASGQLVLGLAEGGIALTGFPYTKGLIGPQRIARLERVRQAIVAGKVVPPASRAELLHFHAVAIR